MALPEHYKQRLVDKMDSDSSCHRCGLFHVMRKCQSKFPTCYNRGVSKIESPTGKKGETEAWRNEAEAFFQVQRAMIAAKPGDKIKDDFVGTIDKVVLDTIVNSPPNGDTHGTRDGDSSSSNGGKGPMIVLSNYVHVKKVPNELYLYSLNYSRPGKAGSRIDYNKRRDIREAFEALRSKDVLGLNAKSASWASDFKLLWSTASLHRSSDGTELPPDTVLPSQSFEFTQMNGKKITDAQVDITFKRKLVNIRKSMEEDRLSSNTENVEALNAWVAQCITMNNIGKSVTRVGANKFYLDRGYVDIGGIRAVRGYFTSVRLGPDHTLLNINPVTSAFLPPIKLSDFIKKSFNQFGLVNDQELAYFSQLLQGASLRILYRRANFVGNDVNYNSENARLKTFVQFGKSVKDQKFYKLLKYEEGKPRKSDLKDKGTSVLQYMVNKASVELKKGLPAYETLCVNVGRRVRTEPKGNESEEQLMRAQGEEGAQWIPACLLQIIPGQVVKTTLSGTHTKEMIDQAMRYPIANANLVEKEGLPLIIGDSTNVSAGSSTTLSSMGLEISRQLMEVPAQTLDQPTLRYAGSDTRDPELGHWNLKRGNSVVSFPKPGNIDCFHLLNLPRSSLPAPVGETHKQLLKQLKAHGLTFKEEKECKAIDHCDQPAGNRMGSFRMFVDKTLINEKHCGLVVIPDKDYDLYAAAKRYADFKGRHVLFAIGWKLARFNRKTKTFDYALQYFSNLALKINIKMGGENHHFQDGKLQECLGGSIPGDTIVLGADIGHSGAGSRVGSPSVACVVGTVNGNMMKYPGSMRLQAAGVEMIDKSHLSNMVKERLRDWKKENDSWPSNMIFYRDGISESQFDACKNKEIETIKEAYKSLTEKDLKLTFVVCGKRHHTRFYARNDQDSYPGVSIDNKFDKEAVNGNLKPGLLVTEGVTNRSSDFNFFLQSHKAIKGTARSAHYHVLEDGMNIGNQNLPRLTMMLCYAFGRATCGVSYVAPAYIADRLCERGRVYLREWSLSSEMLPKLDLAPKDSKGFRRRLTQVEIDQTKEDFAREVASDKTIWGKNNGVDQGDGTVWENPWDPLLNSQYGMFWM